MFLIMNKERIYNLLPGEVFRLWPAGPLLKVGRISKSRLFYSALRSDGRGGEIGDMGRYSSQWV